MKWPESTEWIKWVSLAAQVNEVPGCEAIQDQEGSNLGISDPQNLSLPLVIATHPPPETSTCCRNSWRRLTEADLPHQISEAGCGRGGSKTSYSLKMGPWYCAGLLCSAAYCVTGPLLCWNFSSTVSLVGVERRCCFWGEFNWVKRAPRLTLTFHYNGTPHHTTPSDGWTLSSSSLPLWRDDPWKKKPQPPALWCLTIRTSDPSPKPPLSSPAKPGNSRSPAIWRLKHWNLASSAPHLTKIQRLFIESSA